MDNTNQEFVYGTGVTEVMYSDLYPWEVIEIISDKTLVIREMEATKDPSWKPEMIPGGFSAHCVNNHDQRWNIKSNPNGRTLRIRKCKDGKWRIQKRLFRVGTARRFYDYNF